MVNLCARYCRGGRGASCDPRTRGKEEAKLNDCRSRPLTGSAAFRRETFMPTMTFITVTRLNRALRRVVRELERHGLWDERVQNVDVCLVPVGVCYGWQFYGSSGHSFRRRGHVRFPPVAPGRDMRSGPSPGWRVDMVGHGGEPPSPLSGGSTITRRRKTGHGGIVPVIAAGVCAWFDQSYAESARRSGVSPARRDPANGESRGRKRSARISHAPDWGCPAMSPASHGSGPFPGDGRPRGQTYPLDIFEK